MKKVIFHIDEISKWEMLLKNVQNMLAYYKQEQIEYDIEVLANSKAVEAYVKDKSEYNEVFKKLAKDQVNLVACNNALSGLGIKKEEIFEYITIVAAGVVELVDKQEEAYAYIKP